MKSALDYGGNCMGRLINKTKMKIEDSSSVISFETTGGGSWEIWDRYLTIEGKKAYHIGNICGTCSFFFERMEGANKSISPREVSEQLRDGINTLDNNLLSRISEIIPNGDYNVCLLSINPSIVELGGENDYFTNEQVETWGIDGFWGLPFNPKVKYYRGTTKEFSKGKVLYEFIVPMFPQGWLNEDTVNKYKVDISNGSKPTAISISILDIKQHFKSEYEHWCLTHYLIDGHHKAYSSNIIKEPITLLSFFDTTHGISSVEDIELLLNEGV
jgi:hypothetical protein